MEQAMLGTTPQTDNTSALGQQTNVRSNTEGSDSTSTSRDMSRRASGGGWGWFPEDDAASEESHFEEVTPVDDGEAEYTASAVTAPRYVLEESRSSQHLWKYTAGTRPPQPVEERQFFEQLWAINFAQSKVDYGLSEDELQQSTPIVLSPFADGTYAPSDTAITVADDYGGAETFGARARNNDDDVHRTSSFKESEADLVDGELNRINTDHNRGAAGVQLHRPFGPHFHKHTLVNKKLQSDDSQNTDADTLTVLVKGDNVFGTTVSKSFTKFDAKGLRPENVSVSISIGSYRVVESRTKGKYAQFLVIYCEGDFRETLGVWKRHSDFKELSLKVAAGQDSCACSPLAISDENDDELLPNAMTSWRLLQKRQRWYRCLDAGYLSLKSFLLERFLHDILFESSTPKMLRDFVCADHTVSSKSSSTYAS